MDAAFTRRRRGRRPGVRAVSGAALRRLGASICLVLLPFPAAALAARAPRVPLPRLTASGLPTRSAPDATLTLRWYTGSGVPGAVFLQESHGPPLEILYGERGPGSWPVQFGRRDVFDLYTIGLHHVLLARMTVRSGRAHTQIIARSWIPPRTGSVINRLLQLVPFGMALLFLWLTVRYVGSLRAAEA